MLSFRRVASRTPIVVQPQNRQDFHNKSSPKSRSCDRNIKKHQKNGGDLIPPFPQFVIRKKKGVNYENGESNNRASI